MNPSLDVTPERLRIREGGGCVAVFGLPFFGAGLFLFLVAAGAIPLSNASTMPFYGWPLLALMGVVFTAVGGGLAFGRTWTTIDRAHRSVRRQWGLLVPMRQQVLPYDGATAVVLGFVQGDSDSVDKYPVGLKTAGDTELPLGEFTDYGQARTCAGAIAGHLGLDLEDASSDNLVRMPASQAGLSFRERWRAMRHAPVAPPSNGRYQIHRDADVTTLVIPSAPPHLLAVVAGLAPVAVPVFVGPPLAEFFQQTRTPAPVAWMFLGFLILAFGIAPAVSVMNAFRRSVRGAAIVTVSPRDIRIQQRGAWRTRTSAAFEAADILDIDMSIRETAVAATRRATEREVQRLRQASGQVSPRLERMLTRLSRFVTAKGVVLKTRQGIVTFGEGLEDDEIRYLHDVVRRALAGQ